MWSECPASRPTWQPGSSAEPIPVCLGGLASDTATCLGSCCPVSPPRRLLPAAGRPPRSARTWRWRCIQEIPSHKREVISFILATCSVIIVLFFHLLIIVVVISVCIHYNSSYCLYVIYVIQESISNHVRLIAAVH